MVDSNNMEPTPKKDVCQEDELRHKKDCVECKKITKSILQEYVKLLYPKWEFDNDLTGAQLCRMIFRHPLVNVENGRSNFKKTLEQLQPPKPAVRKAPKQKGDKKKVISEKTADLYHIVEWKANMMDWTEPNPNVKPAGEEWLHKTGDMLLISGPQGGWTSAHCNYLIKNKQAQTVWRTYSILTEAPQNATVYVQHVAVEFENGANMTEFIDPNIPHIATQTEDQARKYLFIQLENLLPKLAARYHIVYNDKALTVKQFLIALKTEPIVGQYIDFALYDLQTRVPVGTLHIHIHKIDTIFYGDVLFGTDEEDTALEKQLLQSIKTQKSLETMSLDDLIAKAQKMQV